MRRRPVDRAAIEERFERPRDQRTGGIDVRTARRNATQSGNDRAVETR